MDKYCCFQHPKATHEEVKLDQLCPDCQLPYGFPLMDNWLPKKIGDYTVIRSLSRGFYGATYVVEKNTVIRTKNLVLKVIPKEMYSHFGKNFIEECKNHAQASEGTQHIVDIEDIFETSILFGNIAIDCHVAELEYVPGNTLENVLKSKLDVNTIGQISIDLLKILSELQSKKLFHNDLHPGNVIIQELTSEQIRIGEIKDSLKAVAIDFGSLGAKSQSGDKSGRIGDLHWIAKILSELSNQILQSPDSVEERDFRLASLLEERAKILFPNTTSQRTYEFEEIIQQIRLVFLQVDSPWKETLILRNFKDSYNAQTLAPWFVSSLLVDDDDKWISEVSNRGPQVITGMRGCGKTMLLRALQFHARATPVDDKENDETVLNKLQNDGYVGLYISCTRLLDKMGSQDDPLHEPFARLFIAYSIEAIRALRHLREINRSMVTVESFRVISRIVSEYVTGAQELANVTTEYEIEFQLNRILNSLSKGENIYSIETNPANAFPALAQAIKQSSTLWNNQYVFFLLDDVSTRFLNDKNIINLVSTLLFQNEYCSFKFTTEMQTLEIVIHSPGNIEKAREGRDYSVFDLGEQVNEKVHSGKKDGILFVERILHKRSKFHNGHPKELIPSQILGNATLKSIADKIGRDGKASDKKDIYHGMKAISSVCVGDIGDVITLYDMILKRRNNNISVSPRDQNECYLELSNGRLFDINRRESRLYDFAVSFSEASHHLLVESYRQIQAGTSSRKAPRQYYSIFINITTGDIEKQYLQIRELIDAGIFNFSGGPEASRTNRQGTNPQKQFKLTYRKLYGLNGHIGLSNSDRFELSGDQLENWLDNPKLGKEILIRNLSTSADEIQTENESEQENEDTKLQDNIVSQGIINFDETVEEILLIDNGVSEEIALSKVPNCEVNTLSDWNPTEVELSLTASAGFEERTFQSISRLVKKNISHVELFSFGVEGKRKEITSLLNEAKVNFNERPISDLIEKDEDVLVNSLIDITGLPQAAIFNSVRSALTKDKMTTIIHTDANEHYPLNSDVEALLNKHQDEDQTQFLESLTNVIKGEKGPYKLIPLLPVSTENYSSRRVLIAFASSKHERLYKLLDEREYDKIHIITPPADNPRNKLAKIAAEVALRKFSQAEIIEYTGDNLQGIMEYLAISYQNYFVDQNYSFEIALTGTKLQTVACAVISSVFKISQCWYVQPAEWDTTRFTLGTGDTTIFKITR